jgi:asparagine synthase (glutamine-hydrolysing)
MRYRDLIHYLPDDILVKVDRATMSTSLESRAPFLDHRIVEFAFRLPREQLVRHGLGKWLLRQVLHRYVPKEMIERPKSGFGLPIADWLRGPLRDWAESLLTKQAVKTSAMFDYEKVQGVWREHISGRYDRQTRLWPILMFQAWYSNTRQSIASSTPVS